MPILLLKLYKYAVVVGSCFPSDYSVAFIAVSDLCVTYFFNNLRFSRTREVLLFKIIFMCNMSSCSRRAIKKKKSRSRWSCGLRQRSAAARFLRSRVQISLRSWMFVSCVYCVMFRQRPRLQDEYSSIGVPPGACVSSCVWYKNLNIEAA